MKEKKSYFRFRFTFSGILAISIACFSVFAWSQDKNARDFQQSGRSAEIAMHAMSAIDANYKYGGSSPEEGIDCSGLVYYVYKEVWGTELPRSTSELSEIGINVNQHDLQPGDLVFYNTRKRKFSHVGIYLGDSKFVHAPSRGGKVRVEDMNGTYWQVRFNGARRLIDPESEKVDTASIIQSFHENERPRVLVRSR